MRRGGYVGARWLGLGLQPACSSKFKVHLSDSPNMGIQNTTAKQKQHAHSDVIVKQYNIMSTQVVSGCHVRGETEIPESSTWPAVSGDILDLH